MSIFRYIFCLGIINIVFGFAWKWVFALPSSILLALLRIDKGIYFVKAFGSYLLVSLTALLTLSALRDNPNIFSIALFPFIGAFVLYMGYASNYYEAQKQASMEFDYELMRLIQYEPIFMIGAIVLFMITLFVPIIAVNPLTKWLFNVIDWAYNLKVIGWLIGVGGVLFLLGVIWHGILISVVFSGCLVGKLKRKAKNDFEKE